MAETLNPYAGNQVVPTEEQCCLFDRMPLVDKQGMVLMYLLILSPGNSLATELCGPKQVVSMITTFLGPNKINVYGHSYPKVMVIAPPTNPWVNLLHRYDPRRIVLCLPPDCELHQAEVQNIIKLHDMGMEFALFVDSIGELRDRPDLMQCLTYMLIKDDQKKFLLNVHDELKVRYPQLISVGFRGFGFNFNQDQALDYDLVLGGLVLPPLTVDPEDRPDYQHDMLRSFAELFSGLFDMKEITIVNKDYALLNFALRQLVSVKELRAFIPGGKYTQKDLRDLFCVAAAFNLFCLADNAALYARTHDPKTLRRTPKEICMESFIYALMRAKLVELIANKFCDDYTIKQSFLVGLLSKTHLLLHDSYANVKDEFMLTAIAGYYDNEETALGKVIKFVRELNHIDQEQISRLKSKDEININKDEIYHLVDRALIWTEIVCRALQI